MKMYRAIFVFLLLCFLPCYATKEIIIAKGEFDLDNYKDELGRIWSDWEAQKGEMIVFITKDGKFISVSTQGATVEVGLKKIDDILRDNGVDWSDLKTIVHNHNRGEGVSNEDKASAKAMWKAGFGGDFQIYVPKTRRLTTVRVEEMYGESTEKVDVQWEGYVKNHTTILQGLVGIEISPAPSDVVFKTYNRPHPNETVIGLYDPPSRKIWAKNYESALHEVGHFIWHEKLSSFEQEQWTKWFNDAKVFPSFLSSYNVREFFAEHYRFFSVGKVALKLTRFDYEPKVIKKYNKIFPDQNVWFNKLETKIELGE